MSTTEKKVPSMSEPETSNSYMHNVDHVQKHYKIGGFMHESDKYAKHASGAELHHKHVQKMARGGKC